MSSRSLLSSLLLRCSSHTPRVGSGHWSCPKCALGIKLVMKSVALLVIGAL